jgi:hypothetical protein
MCRGSSCVDEIHRTKEVSLADIDAIVAENGVSHRQVEKDVGNDDL